MKHLILTILAPALLLAVACASDSKEAVIKETLDCMAANDPGFEQSMMMMFPTAQNLDDARKQYTYVSQAAPLDDLKAARDQVCRDRG